MNNRFKSGLGLILAMTLFLSWAVPTTAVEGLKEDLPTRFDLRDEKRVTKTMAQGELGSCWAVSTIGALESSLLTLEGKHYDLSENNMVTQLSDVYDESFKRKASYGGNDNMAVGYFASWRGPVMEVEDPYAKEGREENILFRQSRDVVKHVQEALFLPTREDPLDNNEIKKALMKYGGVSMTMWKGTPSTYGRFYNEETLAWYYPYDYMNEEGGGHSVTIVGWDDDFPRENFSTLPPGKGAFIAKNTKGARWGTRSGTNNEKGYFYISYYDGMLGDPLDGDVGSSVYTRIDDVDNYDHIYQYDLLGYTDEVKATKKEAWMGNAFIMNKGMDETLDAVSFYTLDEYIQYEIYIQRNFKGRVIQDNLEKLQEGRFSLPGYHTVDLKNSLEVKANERIFIGVKLKSKSLSPQIAIEATKGDIESTAKAKKGQSYIRTGSSWIDLQQKRPQANVCLKVFTTDHPRELLDPEDMKKDVEFFVEWTRTHQADAKEEGYTPYQQAIIEEVRERVQEPLTEDEFIVVLKKLFAMMKDGHTQVYIMPKGHALNMNMIWLSDGIYIKESSHAFKKHDQILSIGGYSPDNLLPLLSQLISHENDYWIKEKAPQYLNYRIFLKEMGLVNDDDTVDIKIRRNGEERLLRVPFQQAYTIKREWPRRTWYETKMSKKDDYGYLRFDDCIGEKDSRFKEISKDIEKLFGDMRASDVDNLILDLRYNEGGFMVLCNEILRYVKTDKLYSDRNRRYRKIEKVADEASLFDGKIYILTSNQTFSASVYTTRIFHDNGLATLVGEPTGENPAFNYHGEGSDGTLPVSGYRFMMTSSKAYRSNGLDNSELSFYPDIPVFTTFNDYKMKQDPQMSTLKKVTSGETIYGPTHKDIQPSTHHTITINYDTNFSVEGFEVGINTKISDLKESNMTVYNLREDQEVPSDFIKGSSSIKVSFATSDAPKDAYLLVIKTKAKEYRVVLRNFEENIEKDSNGSPLSNGKKDHVASQVDYFIGNQEPTEKGDEKIPLAIRRELEFKSWGSFQMIFNKSIKVADDKMITITNNQNEQISILSINAFAEGCGDGIVKFVMIEPWEELEPGLYTINFPKGAITSYYGEVLDELEYKIRVD